MKTTIRNCVFGFKCDKRFHNMKIVDSSSEGSDIRFCDSCQKEVYEINSDRELLKNIKLNRCVYIYREGQGGLAGEPTLGKPAPIDKDI